MKCKEVASMTKERTARVIPNAIQICTDSEKYFFTSFGARDKTYLMLFRVWQNALLDQVSRAANCFFVHFIPLGHLCTTRLISANDDAGVMAVGALQLRRRIGIDLR